VDLPSPDGSTALYVAAQQGHVDVVRALIKAGADVNRTKEGAVAPLHIAAQEGESPRL
jgi:ankyrin repeat protein